MTKNKMLPGPRKDFLDNHPRELAVQTALVKKVCDKVPVLSDQTLRWMNQGIDLANEWRKVGIFYNEIKESLPGKKMTTDFFLQLAPLFVGKNGQQITFRQLEWCSKIAAQPEEFKRLTKIDGGEEMAGFNVMLSHRQAVFGAAGFLELEGERQPQQAHEHNYYLKTLDVLDQSRIKTAVTKLEADPNFGEMQQWPEERTEKFWTQVKPTLLLLLDLAKKLGKLDELKF